MPLLILFIIFCFFIGLGIKIFIISLSVILVAVMIIVPAYMIFLEVNRTKKQIELPAQEKKILPSETTPVIVEKRIWTQELKNKSQNNIKSIIDKYKINLQIASNKCFKVNNYGRVIDSGWQEEMEFFLKTEVRPLLSYYDRIYLDANIYNVFDYINTIVSEEKNVEILTPYEYEQKCADIFIMHGWNAIVTSGSGDQGADVIAEKNNKKIAIQCKMYSNKVGNSAVQEVFSAKKYYNATEAAVITTIGYTKSALDLARKTNVYLITDKNITDFILSFEVEGSMNR